MPTMKNRETGSDKEPVKRAAPEKSTLTKLLGWGAAKEAAVKVQSAQERQKKAIEEQTN